ncbi:MAG: mechanosensitive ion channel [Bacteroidales bacterium]|nr:mechanosensitive ion channel [Bacteroidales bacterium]
MNKIKYFLVLLLLPIYVLGQESATKDTTRAIQPIPVAEITLKATEVSIMLFNKQAVLLPDERKQLIQFRLDTMLFRLNLLREDSRVHIIENLGMRSLNNLQNEWTILNSRFENEQNNLIQLLKGYEDKKQSLIDARILWELTLASLKETDAPELVQKQVGSTITNLRDMESSIQTDSEFLQELLVEISKGLIFSNEILGKIKTAQEVVTQQLFTLNQPPLWSAISKKEIIVISHERSIVEDTKSSLRDFGMNYATRIWLHLFLSCAIILFVIFSFRRLKHLVPEKDILRLSSIKKILNRSVSASFLIVFLLTYLMYDTIPDSIRLVASFGTLIPVLFILNDTFTGPSKKYVFLPVVALFLINVHSLGYSETILNRIFLITIILYSFLSLSLMLWKKSLMNMTLSEKLGKFLRTLGFIYLGLLGISFISIIIGAALLAEFFTYAAIRSSALALILYAASLTLHSIILISLYSNNLQRLNVVKQYHESIYSWFVKVVNLASWIFWLVFTFKLFNIWQAIYQGIKGFLTYEIGIGSLHVSLWDLIVFLFILWLTFWISRIVRIIVEGEVTSRIKMKRGVPGAISLILRIVIITIGLMVAFAATGLEMDKLAILIGALGVGIGFGLQNIFNNLVSGIILAFERPIQEGDIIEIGTLIGTVREIGLRASNVRTFDGAEVIVPNGNLISNELINWTLTDKRRRGEVLVGVKYGTNPDTVLKLLVETAKSHTEILEEPEPLALFTGFGDSSLDFRLLFWMADADQRYRIQSEMNVLVNNAINAAGIEIPFPQRDLHLRSVDDTAGKKLK